eukprot:CFRG8507T1
MPEVRKLEVKVLVGPPCSGKTYMCLSRLQNTHTRVQITAESEEGIGAATVFRKLVSQVLYCLSRQENVVVDHCNASVEGRKQLLEAIKDARPDVDVLFEIVQPVGSELQCLWAYAWKLAENATRMEIQFGSEDGHADFLPWMSELDPAVWFSSHNPKPTVLEVQNSTWHTLTSPLICTSHDLNALSAHPALFVQLRTIYDTDTNMAGNDRQDVVEWIMGWLRRNQQGRLFLMIDAGAIDISENKHRDVVRECATLWPGISFYYVRFPKDWRLVKKHLSPGIIAWLQRRHRLNLFHNDTCYITRTQRHEDLAKAAFIKRRRYRNIDNIIEEGDNSAPGWLQDCEIYLPRQCEDSVRSDEIAPLMKSMKFPCAEENGGREGLFLHGLWVTNKCTASDRDILLQVNDREESPVPSLSGITVSQTNTLSPRNMILPTSTHSKKYDAAKISENAPMALRVGSHASVTISESKGGQARADVSELTQQNIKPGWSSSRFLSRKRERTSYKTSTVTPPLVTHLHTLSNTMAGVSDSGIGGCHMSGDMDVREGMSESKPVKAKHKRPIPAEWRSVTIAANNSTYTEVQDVKYHKWYASADDVIKAVALMLKEARAANDRRVMDIKSSQTERNSRTHTFRTSRMKISSDNTTCVSVGVSDGKLPTPANVSKHSRLYHMEKDAHFSTHTDAHVNTNMRTNTLRENMGTSASTSANSDKTKDMSEVATLCLDVATSMASSTYHSTPIQYIGKTRSSTTSTITTRKDSPQYLPVIVNDSRGSDEFSSVVGETEISAMSGHGSNMKASAWVNTNATEMGSDGNGKGATQSLTLDEQAHEALGRKRKLKEQLRARKKV